jgi:hypothetical protein
MSTIFPGSASVNQIFDGYKFNGTAWDIVGIDLTADYLENSTASATYLNKVSASNTYQTIVANVSNTEIGYLDGVTSAIQTQINTVSGKVPPVGGTTGQVLSKINGTDYNTQWVAQSGGSSVPPAYLPFVSQAFYKSPIPGSSGVPANTNTTYYSPFYVPATTSFDRIGCTTTTVTTAGNARLGIYSDTNGAPDALVLDAGTVSYSANSTPYLITIDQSLTPGWYWLAFNRQSGSSTFLGAVGAATLVGGVQRVGTTSGNFISMYNQTSVTGNFPESATPVSTSSTSPTPFLRAL